MIGEGVSALLERVQTLEDRLFVTLILLLMLVGLGWVAKQAQARYGATERNRMINAGIAIGMFVVAVGMGFVLLNMWNVTITDFVDRPVQIATRTVVTIAIVSGTYVLTGILQQVVYDFAREQTTVTQHQTELAFRLTQVGLYLLAGVLVLGLWQVNLSGLLVGAGFLGIIVGLAARQTLGALIAGFVLMFARPFEIGDWVTIGDREGIVTEISIVNTRVQTFDGEYAMIPNDVVGSSEIVNRTRKGRLRLHVEVSIDYSTDIEHAMEVARDAVKEIDEVMAVPQPDVVVTEFGNSAVILDVRFWIDKPSARRRWRAKTAAIRAVKTAFEREGIKIPFPQRELSGRAETGGFRVADDASMRSEPPADPAPDGGDE